MDRKIIIFGATGNTGLEICKALEAKEIKHSAFVRNGSEQKLQTNSTSIISGDVLQPLDVKNVLTEKDITDVIISLGSRDFRGGGIRYNGTKNIVDALKSNGIEAKIHVISANGVGDSWSNLKWHEKLMCKLVISKAMKDHELQEEAVSSNVGGHHIIRPVGLKNEPGTGKIYAAAEGALPNNSIARADVAKYLVDSMIENVSGEHSICKA